MSHLLNSLNPDAAEAMNSGPAVRQPLPPIGSVVEYTMRPGHGRMGRNRFPAFVMGPSQHGRGLDILVFIDAGDMMDEQMVEQKGPGTEHHCWDWLDDASGAMGGVRRTLASVHQRIGDLEGELKALRGILLGDFDAPAVSFVHIMRDFEVRLARSREPSAPEGLPQKRRPAKKAAKKTAKKAGKRK